MDAAAALSRELTARLGGACADEPGSLLGVEQEFTVRGDGDRPADFRDLLDTLPLAGARLDPADPRAVRTSSGIVVTADGPDAEAATPPIAVQPGCGRDAARWAGAARRELEHALQGTHHLFGYSTHLSVATDAARAPRLGALYTRTFAPGLMLLVDRATSPGLIVRPRVGRTELCGEFVDGPWLRAAAVYAAGSVTACRDVLTGARDFASLPPQLEVATRPARARPGWFVDRTAFGADLLRDGRGSVLRRCDGRRIRAQEHLELAWGAARTALGVRVGRDDLAAVDDLVGGARELPVEADADEIDASERLPDPAPSALGAVGRTWVRPGFVLGGEAATWSWSVFRFRARDGGRTAFVSIPRAHHERFVADLDAGRLDDVLGAYLALAPVGRVLAMSPNEPSLGDIAPSTAAVTERATAGQIARFVPGVDLEAGKDPYGVPLDAPDRVIVPGVAGGEPIVESRRGCLPRMRWIVVGGITALVVIGGLVFALTSGGGDGSSTGTSAAPSPSGGASGSASGTSSRVACGAGTGGLTVDWAAVTRSCRLDLRLGGTYTYPQDLTPYRKVVVTTSSGNLEVSFGRTCKIHDATAQELDNAKDPTNQFRGLSLLGVPVAGLPPGAVVEVVLVAPDGQTLRTGRATADSAGYAEVRVPINVPQAHTIRSVKVWPNGTTTGTPVEIPATAVTSDGRIDGTFPGNRCDRAATLGGVKIVGKALTADEVKQIVEESASTWLPLLAMVTPGDKLDQSPELHADGSEGYAEVTGFATDFDFWPGTAKEKDPKGGVPAYITAYGGALVYPSTAGTAELWDDALGCGPNPLTFGVCTSAGAKLRDVGYLKVGAAFDRPVPIAPSGTATYTFSVGSATVELAAKGGKWSLSGPDDARALIRNNVVFVLVPLDAAKTADYRLSTRVGSRADTQPASDRPPQEVEIVTRAKPVAGDHETANQFTAALSQALSNGDASFLQSRLHPAVLDRYGAAQCATYLAATRAPTSIAANDVGPPTSYAWQTDGLSRDVPNVNSVTATRDGAAVTLHVALVDGTWRWFTDCGTPQAGAR